MLDEILVNKYKDYYILAHNMGKYDGLQLQPYQLKRGKVSILKGRDGSIIKLTLTVGKTKVFHFVDSYKLLPNSLSSLTKAQGCETIKGTFPYTFVNKDNLGYVGPTPMDHYEGEKPEF